MPDLVVLALLVFATLLCSVGITLDFTLSFHDKWWFAPAKIILGMFGSFSWTVCLWRIADKDKIYLYGLFWDVVVCAVAYFLPVFCFGIHLGWKGLVGLMLMTTGLILLKL